MGTASIHGRVIGKLVVNSAKLEPGGSAKHFVNQGGCGKEDYKKASPHRRTLLGRGKSERGGLSEKKKGPSPMKPGRGQGRCILVP